MSRLPPRASSVPAIADRLEAELASPLLDAPSMLDSDCRFACPDGSAERDLPDEAATLALGAALAPRARAGARRSTCAASWARAKPRWSAGVLRALGHEGPVKSPTYTLVELYEVSRLNLYHFDFYRFNDPREWIDAGFRESFNGRNCEPGRMAGEGGGTAAAARTSKSTWNRSGDGTQRELASELAARARSALSAARRGLCAPRS